MKNYETPVEMLFEKAEDCGTTTIELMKLKAIDKSADIVSSFAVKIVLFITILLIIVIFNVGVALWIGDLLGKSYYGFFIVAACYALLSVLLRSYLNQWVKIPISNFIITQMLKQSTS
ncbi:hypothetical protein GCM10011514_50130 [Emticicia aquatilis]|uniref:Phage holin family protein n=1 Tax=Emticicia aquatilis TaxID=1537369 RepID=A0A916Z7V0_9BACT|nr:hypothetical protein [Emticicia aquatilis]GGD80119.1 hypothetical protein GCM10011514_50130 [Emticicia aquatilis]